MIQPTIAEFKAQFGRDFPYASDSTGVMDSDISNAITAASFSINENLFSDQASYAFAYNYLAAHLLVVSLRQSSQGLSGSFSWLENSKSVGSVSQSFSIPDSIIQNPMYSHFAKTYYGAYYLSIIIPRTYGGISAIEGATLG